MIRSALFALLCVAATGAHAEGQLLKLPTRSGVTTTVFWEAAPQARATVLLFPGGGGGFGKVEGGRALGNNFLVRTAPQFVAAGFNVAIFGRPSDTDDLDYADRVAEPHLADVHAVLAAVKARSGLPLWLVGTSRGTISATAAAIREQGDIAGLVLTSSVVSPKKPGAVPLQDLAAIRVPVLVMHHQRDACVVCEPREVPAILSALSQAPVKKLLLVDGGANPTGDTCAALHWHGYIGLEAEAVGLISRWITQPGP
jgi:pimeloyl-ACP methyl ester carboxylesterase